MSKWIDVTHSLAKGMVFWPGQTQPRFELISNMGAGHMANVTKVDMSVHTGTHMDAPVHFIEGGKDIAQMPPEVGVGKVRLMEHRSADHISISHLQDYESRTRTIAENERLFFKTRHSGENWIKEEFNQDYTALSAEAAEFLKKRKLKLVGIDYLSIAPFNDLTPTHRVLLGSEIWIVEGLRLGELQEAEYELICLPLKIEGADGSPVRVLMKAMG